MTRSEDPRHMPEAIRLLVTDPLEQMAGRVVYSQQLRIAKGLLSGGAGFGVDPSRRVSGFSAPSA